MTTFKSEPYTWEVDSVAAKQAIRSGREGVLAIYLHEAADAMNLLGDLSDPPDGKAPTFAFLSGTADRAASNELLEEEFEGTRRQLDQAVTAGTTRVLGWYFRDLSEVLELTASALSGINTRLEWKLKFQRRRPGKPLDPARCEIDRAIEMKLRFGRLRGIKQDSTIADLKALYGVSRATVMRVNTRINRPLQPGSHKKR